MRKVALSTLTPDMRLAKPIYHNHTLLLKENTNDLNRFIDNFMKLGIYSIYVEDALSEGIEIPDAITDFTRLKCKTALHDVFAQLYSEGIVDIMQLSRVTDDILDEIMNNPSVLVSLNDIGTTDDNTLVHSVNTTIYALLMGQQIGLNRVALKKLAEGSLLHDVGKTVLDPEILFKPQKLNPVEFEYIKQHAILGYEILKKNTQLTELSRIIALQHHERLDGSGYPAGLSGDEIHTFAKISAIADMYEALTAERCYRHCLSPLAACEILTEQCSTKLDAPLVALFIQNIAIYPNGSMVHLSNGGYGIVREQNASMPLRPIVRLLGNRHGKSIALYEVDLMKELDLTILEES